jgi:hypothetical protein
LNKGTKTIIESKIKTYLRNNKVMEQTKRIEESPYRRISAEDEEMYAKPSSRTSPSVSNVSVASARATMN